VADVFGEYGYCTAAGQNHFDKELFLRKMLRHHAAITGYFHATQFFLKAIELPHEKFEAFFNAFIFQFCCYQPRGGGGSPRSHVAISSGRLVCIMP
jgi:hypothetical protein